MEKETTFGQRLGIMLREANIGISELADMLEINRSTIYLWEKGKYEPKGKTMRNLEEVFSQFNPVWINHGRGQMYKDSTIPSVDQVEQLLDKLRDKEQVIELLRDKVKSLEEKITKQSL